MNGTSSVPKSLCRYLLDKVSLTLLLVFSDFLVRVPEKKRLFYRRGYFKKWKRKRERKVVSTISTLLFFSILKIMGQLHRLNSELEDQHGIINNKLCTLKINQEN